MPPNISRWVIWWDLQGLFWENLEAHSNCEWSNIPLTCRKNKNSLSLSPEVVAFQNSLPLNKGWGRQYPKQAAPRGGGPFTGYPNPHPLQRPCLSTWRQVPTVPAEAQEDVGKKTPDHSILCLYVEKGESENLSHILAQYVWLGKSKRNEKKKTHSVCGTLQNLEML